MQIFNIITNIFTIVGTIVGCAMFYFTFKNHKWLVEDRKKQIEREIKQKLNTIFSYVAQCLINNISITEKVPKSIVEFIKNDIDNELLGLKKQKQVQIENAKQENDLQRENFTLQQKSNLGFNFSTMFKMEEQYDNSLRAKLQSIEQNFLMEKEKLFKNIINQYQYGNRLNKMDCLKLQSHLKNDKQIDELYQMATNKEKLDDAI